MIGAWALLGHEAGPLFVTLSPSKRRFVEAIGSISVVISHAQKRYVDFGRVRSGVNR
jgi:hypothetical protein